MHYLLNLSCIKNKAINFGKFYKERMGLNFCGKFIFSTSLILELADFNFVQTLLNPPLAQWHSSFLLSESIAFANEKKDLVV